MNEIRPHCRTRNSRTRISRTSAPRSLFGKTLCLLLCLAGLRSGQSHRAIQWSLEPVHLKAVKRGSGGERERGVSIDPNNFEKDVTATRESNDFDEESYSEKSSLSL